MRLYTHCNKLKPVLKWWTSSEQGRSQFASRTHIVTTPCNTHTHTQTHTHTHIITTPCNTPKFLFSKGNDKMHTHTRPLQKEKAACVLSLLLWVCALLEQVQLHPPLHSNVCVCVLCWNRCTYTHPSPAATQPPPGLQCGSCSSTCTRPATASAVWCCGASMLRDDWVHSHLQPSPHVRVCELCVKT